MGKMKEQLYVRPVRTDNIKHTCMFRRYGDDVQCTKCFLGWSIEDVNAGDATCPVTKLEVKI